MAKKKTSEVTLRASQKTGQSVTWAQLNLSAAEDLRGLMRRFAPAAELMLMLVSRMQPGGGGVIVISRNALVELMGTSMSTVERSLKLLIAEGWVQRIKIGGAQALAINSRVAWIGPRGDLPFAVFTATVVASRKEQDSMSLNPPPVRPLPVMLSGEIPMMVGEGLEPPSQPDLVGVPPVVGVQGSAGDQAELEARGQQRLNLPDGATVTADGVIHGYRPELAHLRPIDDDLKAQILAYVPPAHPPRSDKS